MALQKFTDDMHIIAKLDDEPNDVGGLTADELKAKFDEGGVALQRYINETMLPQLETMGVEQAVLLPENAGGFKYMRLNSDKVLEVSTDGKTWQATGSSGHLIFDKYGKQMPQRSRIKFADSEVTDDGTYTIVQGEAVKFSEAQSLTPAQQAQARDNINAPAPYEAGDNISITGRIITTKAFPCNPKILDNWYFGNPVNQRGQTSYTGARYTIDRWKLDVGDGVTIDNGLNIIKANSYLGQYFDDFDKYIGRQLVGSVLMGDGNLYTGTYVYNGILNQVQILFANNRLGMYIKKLSDTLTQVEINTVLANEKIRAVGLELGSQQTLAHKEYGVWVLNEIPKFGDQLVGCQRYAVELNRLGEEYPRVGIGQARTSTQLSATIDIPPMRAKPAITTDATKWALCNASTFITATQVAVNAMGNNCMEMFIAAPNLTPGAVYEVFMSGYGKALLSADL